MGRASRRKRQRQTDVPTWAAPLTAGAYQRFHAEFAASLAAAELEVTRYDVEGGAYFVRPNSAPPKDGEDIELRIGVVNPLMTLRSMPLDQWRPLIDRYVATAHDAFEARSIKPFASVADRLRVRIFPDFAEGSQAMVGRQLAPGLMLTPVVDSPASVRAVSPNELTAWAQSLDELIERGLAGLIKREPLPAPQLQEVGPAVHVVRYDSDSTYVAAHLARLGDLVERPERGAIVAVPRRDLLLLHPLLASAEAMAATEWLAAMAPEIHEAGPYGLSPYVYWWRAGELQQLTFARERPDEILLAPPVELRAIFSEALGTGHGRH